jgi:hypothetical protein
MQKATITEAAILLVSGTVAGSLANELADHDVAVMAVISTVLATLTAGLYLATQIGQGLRTVLYTCPTKGCPVSVRAKDVSDQEKTRFRAYATDHAQHGSAR